MLVLFWKLPDWLQHTALAAAAMGIVGIVWALLLGDNGHWAGALVGAALYYGREIRDSENADPALYDSPAVLAFWRWRKDQFTDFAAPLAGNVALAVLVEVLT